MVNFFRCFSTLVDIGVHDRHVVIWPSDKIYSRGDEWEVIFRSLYSYTEIMFSLGFNMMVRSIALLFANNLISNAGVAPVFVSVPFALVLAVIPPLPALSPLSLDGLLRVRPKQRSDCLGARGGFAKCNGEDGRKRQLTRAN